MKRSAANWHKSEEEITGTEEWSVEQEIDERLVWEINDGGDLGFGNR